MGPTEHNATRPKLSFSACLSLRTAENPIPNAIINGTVIGPVVTPPESNATVRKSCGTMLAKMNMIGYKIKSICASGIPNNIRSTAATRNIPTPVATAIISV